MFDRRNFVRTAGAALGGSLFAGSASAQMDVENYELVGTAPVPGAMEAVTDGDWAYVAHEGYLTTVDVNNPEFPTIGGRAEGEDVADETPDVDVGGDVAVLSHNDDRDHSGRLNDIAEEQAGSSVTESTAGVSVFDVSDPLDPTFESFYPANDTIHNAFVKEDPAGDVYAYLCVSDSVDGNSFSGARLVIVDVTDPANPETLEGEDESYEDATDLPDDERGTGGAWMLRDAREDMTKAALNPLHDVYVEEDDAGNELAYCCFWEAGVVVVDVTEKRQPVAVGHFGAVPVANEQPTGAENLAEYVGGGEKSNAHYCQPTPEQDYTFVGAETFPGPGVPPGEDTAHVNGDHGGIRVFDTREVQPIAEGGTAIYPEADPMDRVPPDQQDRMEEGEPVQNPDPDRRNPDNPADMVAYIPAPEQRDDAALTSHNFDVTDGMLFASWYQGGVRAYDLTTLYRGGAYEEHSRDPSKPLEVGAFAPDGMAFWTAVNVDYEEADTIYTLGSDIGKGAVVLKLDRDPGGLF